MNYDRAALKYEVKEDMRLIRPRPLLATLIFLLVSAALTGLIQWLQSWMTAGGIQELMDLMGLVEMAEYGLISDEELVQAVVELFGSVGSVAGISMLFALLSSLITWTLSFGYQGYCLDMVRRKDPSYGRLACALPQLGWVLLTGFLVTVFTFLWTLLMTLGAVVVIFLATLLFGNSFLTSLIAFAALLALAAGVIAISLRYSHGQLHPAGREGGRPGGHQPVQGHDAGTQVAPVCAGAVLHRLVSAGISHRSGGGLDWDDGAGRYLVFRPGNGDSNRSLCWYDCGGAGGLFVRGSAADLAPALFHRCPRQVLRLEPPG